ncbi:hypothetical protein FSW04_08860 [Baekduia soli]|uniref:RlpA-like protein double-psi beta-barrel domain-containing protein n=1 Tax=Baekduia soli TaxID=496014 RepID=A0A5B8U4U5_9ACTN|nr:septal ring lytic transglycosylase RlpA family protein [Baekduia soli]QEC47672.1 hypothetical protein FSW04_08860 [Baekduia soli]
MRTEHELQTTTVKLGAALGALAIALPTAVAAADATPAAPAAAPAPAAGTAPSPGGLGFSDPSEPSVFADGSTLVAPLAGLLGDIVPVTGTLAGSHPGDSVVVQQLDASTGWVQVATATVAADGTYSAGFKPGHSGHPRLRVVAAGQPAPAATAASDAAGGRELTVFHRARATWYGPGFYGRRTACGRRLTKATLGVAHKTLPCGTLVELYKDGRTVTVPVIDRGPFRAGTSYDLTAATAQALGVTTTTVLGAVRATDPAPAVVPAPS